MRSLRNAADRQEILRRLRGLAPGQPRRWGVMNAPRMICHVSDAMRVALGDLPAPPAGNLLTRTIGRWLIVQTPMKAPEGRIRTLPVMLTSVPKEWPDDLAACEALIERIGKGEGCRDHPAFGPLDADGWGRLTWKHLDHHLRQFGA